jgi:hypothetical protein
MKINFIYVVLVALLGFSVSSCKKTENNPELTLDKNLIKSAEKYAALIEKRTDGPGSFTIEDIKRNGDVLTISIKGGCKEEDFNVVWDGSIAFSDPGQVNLVLNNTSESDCGLENQLNIKVNLSKILDKHDPKNFMFNVANGSVKQDKSLNPNGSVTSK